MMVSSPYTADSTFMKKLIVERRFSVSVWYKSTCTAALPGEASNVSSSSSKIVPSSRIVAESSSARPSAVMVRAFA